MNDPKELIQRLEMNPGDPELQRQIDRMAWESFHDTWECPPIYGPNLNQAPNEERLVDAYTVHPLSIEFVKSVLEEMKVPHTLSASEELIEPFDDPDSNHKGCIKISVQGHLKNVLVWRMISDRRLIASQFSLGLCLCNDWAAQGNWTKAFLNMTSGENANNPPVKEPTGSIELIFHYPVHEGASKVTLQNLLIALSFSGIAFQIHAKKYVM